MSEAFIYDWSYTNDEETNQTIIRAFALNEKNESVCLVIEDFSPYIYIELPSNVEWNRGSLNHLRNNLESVFFPHQPILTKIVKRKKLYYTHFDKQKKPLKYLYLQVYFETAIHLKSISFKLGKPIMFNGRKIQLKVHEHNATPILQLVCSQNLKTTGWVKFDGELIETDRISLCDHEYRVSFTTLEYVEKDIIPLAMVLSYDLEVYSSNPHVMPNANKPEDVIFQISMVFSQGNSHYKYLLTLGQPDEKLVGEDAITLSFNSEAMLIKEFGNLILKHNPQIITGYNIYGFDYPYLMGRAQYNRVSGSLHRCGMLKDVECPRQEINWSSSAYGKQDLCYIDMDGRITIDILTLVRREFKLDNYKLETVSNHFLQSHKDPLTHLDIFRAYETGVRDKTQDGMKLLSECGKYCVQDSDLVRRLFEKLQVWIVLNEMGRVCNVPSSYLYTKGQQIRVFSQVYKFCYDNEIVVENNAYKPAINEDFEGAKVFEPEPNIYNYVVPFDFCLSGDTLVNLPNGCSRRLDNLNDRFVLGYFNNGLSPFENSGLQIKGKKKTVQITLQDETTITSTPDHKFMLDDGTWVRADELENKYVKSSVRFPEDKICPLEDEWTGIYDTREKNLAFARVLGYMTSMDQCTVSGARFNTRVDANAFMNDIELLTGIRPGWKILSPDVFCIFVVDIPYTVGHVIDAMFENSTIQLIPDFLLENNCPLSVIREFLAGMFSDYSGYLREDVVAFSEFNEERRAIIQCLLNCLGVDSVVGEYTHRRYKLFLTETIITNIDDFVSEIGFRYNVTKTFDAAAYRQMNANPEKWSSLEDYKEYSGILIDKHSVNIPTFRQKVISVKEAGMEYVYDIEVDKAHNFIANGVVAHNCSLYPSIIVAYNIDYSTLVLDDDIPDNLCHVIEWETHEKCQHTEYYDPLSTELKCETYRFRFLKEPRGVLPTIVQDLLDIRKKTRSIMKDLKKNESLSPVEKETMLGILNQRQLSYKVSANSMYGAMGVQAGKGYLPFKVGAMCVTAMGRKNLEKAAKHLQTKYDAELVYGDSVSGDTPLILRDKCGKIHIKTIESISNSDWLPYDGFKAGQSNRREKQQTTTQFQVWVNGKWADIIRVIRHKTKKQLYTINTNTGCVIVTEDHSLCDKNGEKVKPIEVDIGTELLHSFPSDLTFDLLPFERKIFSQIPKKFMGRAMADKYETVHIPYGLPYKTMIDAQECYCKFKSCGLNPTIYVDNNGIYWLRFDEVNFNAIAIKKIIKHNTDIENTFVYDLETSEGKFNAGIGEMTLFNTDSCYTMFPHIPPEKLWEHATNISNEMYEEKIFPHPMKLEFEEAVYDPFLILTKKRYMYKTFSRDGVHQDKIGQKGVLLNRRDNSAFIRDVYREVVDMIFQKKDKDTVLNHIVERLNECCSSSLSLKDFIITKRINDKNEYKIRALPTDVKKRAKRLQDLNLAPDSTEEEYILKSLPAHIQLAEKMKSRGVRVDVGQRLEYVITSRGGINAKNFDKIEDPDYVKEYGEYVKLEYLYYIQLLSGQLDDVIYTVFKVKDFAKNQVKLRAKKQKLLDDLRLCFTPIHIFEDRVPQIVFE